MLFYHLINFFNFHYICNYLFNELFEPILQFMVKVFKTNMEVDNDNSGADKPKNLIFLKYLYQVID